MFLLDGETMLGAKTQMRTFHTSMKNVRACVSAVFTSTIYLEISSVKSNTVNQGGLRKRQFAIVMCP